MTTTTSPLGCSGPRSRKRELSVEALDALQLVGGDEVERDNQQGRHQPGNRPRIARKARRRPDMRCWRVGRLTVSRVFSFKPVDSRCIYLRIMGLF